MNKTTSGAPVDPCAPCPCLKTGGHGGTLWGTDGDTQGHTCKTPSHSGGTCAPGVGHTSGAHQGHTPERDPTDLGLSKPPGLRPHHCRNGWLGDDDHPAPCPTCKPHLRRRPDGTWHLNRPTKAPKPTKETR